MEEYTPATMKALADLTLYLNDPRAEMERVTDEPEVPLAELLKREGYAPIENPWLSAKAQQERVHEHHGDVRSRRHDVLADFLKAKLAEGFSVSEIVEHASKVNAEIGSELRSIAAEIRQ